MTSRKSDLDEPFFREWRSRRIGEKRSLSRARALMKLLALNELSLPSATVVGSKGKATTAVYAAAALAARGLRVGLLTSPPILENRERIRIDGVAMDEAAYASISKELASKLDQLASRVDGYLSPTGLFTLMAMRYFVGQRCDVAILEAGLGGLSDEVSLFPAKVAAVTRIFEEHADIIGPTVRDIAQDKAGVICGSTKTAFSIRQTNEVWSVLDAQARSVDCELVLVEESTDGDTVSNARGLSVANALLGIRTGNRLAESIGRGAIDKAELSRLLKTIRTPGRLSEHTDSNGRRWIVDASIDVQGIECALKYCDAQYGRPTTILVSVPDSKNVELIRDALAGRDYVPVQLREEHLSFSSRRWGRELVSIDDIDQYMSGTCILALGTWSFVALLLEKLHVKPFSVFST